MGGEPETEAGGRLLRRVRVALDPGPVHDPGEADRIAGLLRAGITTGEIPPGELFSSWRVRWLMYLNGNAIRSAGAALRREGIVFCHDREHYTAPAGPPQTPVSARLGRALAEARSHLGISVAGLAAQIADDRGPWGPGGWEHMLMLRMADIIDIEAGAWRPRWVWEYVDTALNVGGTLLHIHDNLYAHQAVGACGRRYERV